MARSELSRREKTEVWKNIEEVAGPMTSVEPRRKDWRESPQRNLSVFVTFSRDDQLFYDIHPDDLKGWLAYERAFVVFVMGTHEEVLIVPVRSMQRLVEGLVPKGYGEHKLHIIHNERGYEFREVPGHSLTPFHNSYELLAN